MLGIYVTGEIPFTDVYLHGLVLGPDGQKMSKSKGNVVNPIEQLSKFGADAVRLGLITNSVAGANQPYSDVKATGGRNFCNKLWNIARYTEEKVGDQKQIKRDPNPQTMADHWILWKLQQSIETVSSALDRYRFGEAWDNVYRLVWDDFADWYIEASKTDLNPSMLAYGLEVILKLAHPFAPFVTETIWQTLAWEEGSYLAISQWPEATKVSKTDGQEFEEIITLVSEVRQLMAELNVRGRRLYYHGVPFLKDNAELVKRLAKLIEVREVEDGLGLQLTRTKYPAWLDVDNDTIVRYNSMLSEVKTDLETQIKKLDGRLANKAYIKQAPKEVVEESRQQLEDLQARLKKTMVDQTRFSN